MIAGSESAFAASLWAVRTGGSGWFSWQALTISTLECLFVGVLIVMDVLYAGESIPWGVFGLTVAALIVVAWSLARSITGAEGLR